MTLDSMSICILHYENRRSAGRANVAVESTTSVSALQSGDRENISKHAVILMDSFISFRLNRVDLSVWSLYVLPLDLTIQKHARIGLSICIPF